MYNYTISKKSIGAASTLVVAANPNRHVLILSNDSNEAIYIALGQTAIKNQGIALAPNTTFENRIELKDETNYTGIVNAICASGTKNLAIIEGE